MVVSTMYCTSYSTHFTYVTKVPKLLIHTYVSVTVSYSSLSVGLIGDTIPTKVHDFPVTRRLNERIDSLI